jgi:ADP-ribosyl-[dinitrogen reductase] hydrolase
MTIKNENSFLSFEDRVRGALWGGLTGDAFCLGGHWIYSLYEIAQRFPEGIKGFETPSPGHYHYGKKAGDFTHYGDAALLQLSSVAQNGRFEAVDFGSRLFKLMISENYKGYRDHATQGTIANYRVFLNNNPEKPFDYQQGADDDQPATVTRLAPVVVAHLNDLDLLETVAKATRVCQNNRRAIVFTQAAALILRDLLNGSTPESAVAETRQTIKPPDKACSEVNKKMKIACAARMLSAIDATMLFGQSCPLNSSFTAALHTMLIYSNDFASAIQSTANAGGDSAGRAAMVGAWLGAHLGIQAIPEAWRTRLTAHDQIEADVERIVARMALPAN